MPAPPSQSALFDEAHPVAPAAHDEATQRLALALAGRYGDRLHLGPSSWNFPGWQGLVWRDALPEATLSRHGLAALSRHPLIRCVSLDRSFYRPLPAAGYAALRAQAAPGFRFVVKAWSAVTDAVQRSALGAPQEPNPLFLDPRLALEECARPAADGLGDALGALVFQLSPLPARWLDDLPGLLGRLSTLWQAVVPALPAGARAALELRDARLLVPEMAAHLRAHGVLWCVGLHDRMPPLRQQLPMLRALWPDDLLCRWNLQRGSSYEAARNRFAPFDRLAAPDPETREELARIAAATLERGRQVFVTVNNKAEGSAPLSVLHLAEAIQRRSTEGTDGPGG